MASAVMDDLVGNVSLDLDRAQTLAEIKGVMSKAVEKGFGPEDVEQEFGLILDALDYNARARFDNSVMSTLDNAPLMPLRTSRNGNVEGLPKIQSGIEKLSSKELNRILKLYGLKTDGKIWARQEELKRYLGVTFPREYE